MLPGRNSAWLEQTTDAHSMPPMPWRGAYGIQQSGFRPEDFDGLPPPHDEEAPSEFTMKILCSSEKIGGVIGKGGLNVKQLQQKTGASIHVDNVSTEWDERVLSDQSQTINAILQLQNKSSQYSEKGTITTRLLALSSKVGCILGQGGHVTNEMRRRTHADILVFSKEDKPQCASEDEEIVQITGSFGVAEDALVEITSRLRTRCLRDANSKDELAPVRPLPRFGPMGNLRGGGLPPPSVVGAGSSRRYEHLKGGVREYELPSFPFHPCAPGYLNANEAMISLVSTMGGTRISEVGCILGQGGHVTNEMRRRTHADILVFSKEDKPKCASEDEEIVQITGSFGVAEDALVEITSRLRTRCLRDASSRDEPAPVRPLPRFGPVGNLRGGGLPPPSVVGAGSSRRYEHLKGGVREYELPSFPFHPCAPGYLNANEAMISLVSTMGGTRISEIAGERVNIQDPYPTQPEFGSSEHFNASRNMYDTPASSVGPNNYPRPDLYQSYNPQPTAYPNTYASTAPYPNYNPQPVAYQNDYTQQGPHQNITTHGSYKY
ncbi:hypothetical protein BUALT_Bualt04G0080800 [Buddleja alternifolia]|uniref:K Homology domain-containing protein n=1 Tax=Buddleja alternifolia TaxID=168488 RepID=A0AAV6XRL8_9LAMI|nr:hypothetical protein BUALT_Bualt04G0080800 [Buddleja alternifolia]